jgi:hypothetical protein
MKSMQSFVAQAEANQKHIHFENWCSRLGSDDFAQS